MRRLPPVAFLLIFTACSWWPGQLRTAIPVSDPPEAFLDPSPPPLTVFPPNVDSDLALDIPAFTYCWAPDGAGTCADGVPQYGEYRVQLAGPGALELTWMGLSGWSFSGSARPASDPVASETSLEVARVDGIKVVFPEEGMWDVTLFGHGPQGDAAYAFRITVGPGS